MLDIIVISSANNLRDIIKLYTYKSLPVNS